MYKRQILKGTHSTVNQPGEGGYNTVIFENETSIDTYLIKIKQREPYYDISDLPNVQAEVDRRGTPLRRIKLLAPFWQPNKGLSTTVRAIHPNDKAIIPYSSRVKNKTSIQHITTSIDSNRSSFRRQ